MSNKPKQRIDLQSLHANLKDLDYISKRVSKELIAKNEILKGGLRDCAQCRALIDDSTQKSN